MLGLYSMNKFMMIFFGYLFGAVFINMFCVNFLMKIPLIDYKAIGIRNVLCTIWLIFVIISVIFIPSDK